MRQIFPGLLAILLATLACASCGRQAPAAAAATQPTPPSAAGPRIVSTVPAATLNLILFGAADELVGVSTYDTLYLPEAQKNLPVVGDYETMNYEQLVKLKPTVLVIQMAESRIPARLREIAAAQHFALINMHFQHVSDIWESVKVLGKAAGREKAAEDAITRAQLELQAVADDYKNAPHPKVVYLISPRENVIAGAKSFSDEMIAAAGGNNVGAQAGDQYPQIGRETLVKLQPEVLLLGEPDQVPQMQNDPRLAAWTDLPIPAARNHRIYLVTDGNSQMASLDIGKNVRELARMIHAGDPPAEKSGAPGDTP